MNQKLPAHEWLIICLLLCVLGLIIAIAYIREEPSLPQTDTVHEVISSTLQVTIIGAVERPGHYTMERGDTVEDILQLAKPLPEADLKRLKLKSRLRDGQKVKVPVREMITIFLEGAVDKAGPIQIPKGTKKGDLHQYCEFSEEADLTRIAKKQVLQDQEVVLIPEKKKKKKRVLLQKE